MTSYLYKAMNLPIGKLFYFVPKASERVTESGKERHGEPVVTTCLDAGCENTTYSDCAKNLYDRFYNDEFFDQSKGAYSAVTRNTTPVIWTSCTTGSEFTDGVSAFGGDGSVRTQIIKLCGFNTTGAGRLTGPNGNEMDTEEFL